MPDERKGDREQEKVWSELARYSHFGFQLALSTGFFLAVGWWLDGRLGSTPILTILGAMVGAGASFYSMYFHLVIEPRRRRSRSDEQGSEK